MGTYTDIQQALDIKMETLSASSTVYYDNQECVPTVGNDFIRCTLNYGLHQMETLAGLQRIRGTYTVDVFTSIESGPGALNTQLDSIRDHFLSGRSLTRNSTIVRVRDVPRNGGIREGAWYRGSCTVEWETFAT